MGDSRTVDDIIGDTGRRFTYGRWGMKLLGWILVVSWALAWAFLPNPSKSIILELLLGGSFFFFLIIIINACLMGSDVEIRDEDISWLILQWRWRTIKWSEVTHIRVSLFWDFERRKNTKSYYICISKKFRPYFLPNGCISFNDNIENLARLKRLVKNTIESRQILVEGRNFD